MKHIRREAPIQRALMEFAEKQPKRFHVPGHKGGHCIQPNAYPTHQTVMKWDVTELTGLDDLHHPEGMIADAQMLAAQTFFAEQTFFLVNGSTVGNISMILATMNRGKQVLVQRNSHKSIFHGLALAGAEAIFLEPEVCPTFAVPIGLHVETVKQAVGKYPKAKGLILTYPNYYGMAGDIQEMVEYVHHKGLFVLVDEAHGAHFGQYTGLPPSAMNLGADISVQSTHKMLTSMTMTSMLHVQGNRVSRADLKYYLQSLQSSSPSYPLMASLDLARQFIQDRTEDDWRLSIAEYEELRTQIGQAGYVASSLIVQEANQFRVEMDPYKLTIRSIEGLSGYALQERLEQKNIYCEMADPQNILLTLPLDPVEEWNQALVQELQNIYVQHKPKTYVEPHISISSKHKEGKIGQPIVMKSYREHEQQEVLFSSSIGKIATEMIIPYPPGIPLILSGERITSEAIQSITQLQEKGAYFQGKNRGFKTIKVEV